MGDYVYECRGIYFAANPTYVIKGDYIHECRGIHYAAKSTYVIK